MANVCRQLVLDRLWQGLDPFAQFPAGLYARNMSGWNSDHRYLAEAIVRYRPGIVVEVGVWMGRSVITMARAMRDCGCDGVIIAVDTWLGSSEHWLDPQQGQNLGRLHGYPQFYWNFLANIVAEGLQDFVLPLPLELGLGVPGSVQVRAASDAGASGRLARLHVGIARSESLVVAAAAGRHADCRRL